jgi:ribonuclease Z
MDVPAPEDTTATGQASFRVILLGTGMPVPAPGRAGPAALVEVGNQKVLFDAGRCVATRLFQLGVPLRAVAPLFLTHFHSDHTVGVPDLWLSGWLAGP